ncbi:MAG: pseudouridine synthase [Luteolibacter sp.]|uniref:pseudouridine synthase n=1 Tax=Luteolibacter sp. TaxID=1962973 RepID=UPI0032673819
MRLDRFLIRRGIHSGKEVVRLLADGRVKLDGEIETNGLRKIDRFSWIELDDEILQSHEAIYLMLHKPAGYLSATTDPLHPTVIELIDHPLRAELHLAGRLDRASTGLLLLTNDGRWSKRVTEPVEEIPKIYRVTTREAISPETATLFAAGIYFAYEDLTTRPAVLEILSERKALLTIHEGRYHQVKRMFHAVGNQVLSLHREQIGPLVLNESLPEGKYRHLSADEVSWFSRA